VMMVQEKWWNWFVPKDLTVVWVVLHQFNASLTKSVRKVHPLHQSVERPVKIAW
jgi:hypothetical protein